jgi:carbon starvation protein CstA
MMSSVKKVELFFVILLIITAAFFLVTTYLDWFDFSYSVGSYRFNHWLVWIGSLYIAFTIPVYTMLKKRYPIKTRQLLGFHVFGNLSAFVLISIHFSSQISRPAAFYPELGTGLAMFLSMLLSVSTGFSHRFGIVKNVKPQAHRLIHVGLAFAFYLVIGIHILHGLGYL